MTCAEAVRTHLLTLAPLTALVNARVSTVQWQQSPTLPAVLVTQISDVTRPHLRGTDGLKMARIQVDCLGATMADARSVDRAVLGDYTGGVATGLQGCIVTAGTITIHNAIADGYREFVGTEELKGQKRTSRDYRVWYEE